MKAIYKLIMILAVASLTWGSPAFAEDPAPYKLVVETSQTLLAKLKAERETLRKSPDRIYELVSTIVLPKFDFAAAGAIALGKYARTATPQQRARFTDEFRNLLVRTYASSLIEYADRKITYHPLRMSPDAQEVTVKTEVREPSGPPIPIDYALHLKDGQWLVYDVTIDNVSIMANYRTSFGKEIREKGLDTLIATLAAKNKTNVATPARE